MRFSWSLFAHFTDRKGRGYEKKTLKKLWTKNWQISIDKINNHSPNQLPRSIRLFLIPIPSKLKHILQPIYYLSTAYIASGKEGKKDELRRYINENNNVSDSSFSLHSRGVHSGGRDTLFWYYFVTSNSPLITQGNSITKSFVEKERETQFYPPHHPLPTRASTRKIVTNFSCFMTQKRNLFSCFTWSNG